MLKNSYGDHHVSNMSNYSCGDVLQSCEDIGVAIAVQGMARTGQHRSACASGSCPPT